MQSMCITLGGFSCSFGALANWTTEYNWHVSPGIDMSYKLSDKLKSLLQQINQSVCRLSLTYITLSPYHLDNPNLKPEEAVTYEAGIKYN